MGTFDDLEFELLPEHLLLLNSMYVGWQHNAFGAPEIDPKRPYGNSDVYMDMVEILGVDLTAYDDHYLDPDYDGELPPELVRQLDILHDGTQLALQLLLTNGRIEPGVYTADWAGRNWKPKDT